MAATIPLRIDSELIHQARNTGALADRPPTAQIEHWARLGRVLDTVLSGASALKVKQLGRVDDLDRVVTISQTEAGRKKARSVIARHGGPVYEADPDDPALVVERQPDGTVRRGRFAHRQFIPVG
ncbi:hypothetical protein OPIT5_18895 [Opitutaceae bacterium TAV5]|nr:hypothetical protein OPIT5_18895 [Opitutaceae bacterium TAV5]